MSAQSRRYEAALRSLGTTADEVAASLEKLGVLGQRQHGEHCPLARYLTECFGKKAFVGHDDVAIPRHDKPQLASEVLDRLPVGSYHFVRQFDGGAYPMLDEDWGREDLPDPNDV